MTAVIESEHAELPPTRDRRVRRAAPVAALVIVLVGLGGLALWRGQDDEGTPGPRYSSAQQMAEAAGCADSFRSRYDSASPDGTSMSAGSCTVNGTDVDLIIYPTMAETSAWLDAVAYAAAPDQVASVHGYPWGAAVHTHDRAIANHVFLDLGA